MGELGSGFAGPGSAGSAGRRRSRDAADCADCADWFGMGDSTYMGELGSCGAGDGTYIAEAMGLAVFAAGAKGAEPMHGEGTGEVGGGADAGGAYAG